MVLRKIKKGVTNEFIEFILLTNFSHLQITKR